MDTLSISVSSPGKVLVSGGYLILDSKSPPGLVISTSSRFYSTASTISSSTLLLPTNDATNSSNGGSIYVLVESLQFRTQWKFTLQTCAPFNLSPVSVDSKRNPYAEFAIELGISAVCGSKEAIQRVEKFLKELVTGGYSLKFQLQADNEFYSQRLHLESRGLPINLASLSSLPKFLPCPLTGGEGSEVIVNKTGLGSSAALVTSLVGATAALFTRGSNNSREGSSSDSDEFFNNSAEFRSTIHNAAQIAHGLAQGKVGSGFDVSSATFGSILFSRIPPDVLGAFMEEALESVCGKTATVDSFAAFSDKLARVSLGCQSSTVNDGGKADDGLWKFTAEPLLLPRGVSIMLADVVGGSETPSMVRKVLAWRDAPENNKIRNDSDISSNIEAGEGLGLVEDEKSKLDNNSFPISLDELEEVESIEKDARRASSRCSGPLLWRQLGAANARVASVFAALNRLEAQCSKEDYDAGLMFCATHPRREWNLHKGGHESRVCRTLYRLTLALSRARTLLRSLGEEAGVPIEPPQQTALANDTLEEPGVIAAGVPGAGGFDALFAVIISKDGGEDVIDVRGRVEKRWLLFGNKGLTPLPLHEGRGLEVKING